MSLDFAIIPITDQFIASAKKVQNKLNESIITKIHFQFDTNYDATLNNRINKWKKQDFNVVVVDNSFEETNTIAIRFSDKRSTPEVMDVDEFIELVASFEDKDQHNIYHTSTKNSDEEDESNDDNNNCIIM